MIRSLTFDEINMSDHSSTSPAQNDQAKPNLAALAKQLFSQCSAGALATQSMKHDGFPYASMVPYAMDDQFRPLIFVSGLATHTRNLKANSRASLLVAAGESQADARATLMGTMQPVPESEREDAMETYLQRHPNSRQWASFGDFALMRMEILDLYFVGGFGVMGWVKPDEYAER